MKVNKQNKMYLKTWDICIRADSVNAVDLPIIIDINQTIFARKGETCP